MNAQSLTEKVGVAVESTLSPLVGSVLPAAAVEVQLGSQTLYRGAFGLDSSGQPTKPDTLFDLDAFTELVTATAYLRLVDLGRVWLDTPVAVVLPDFGSDITFYHLLTHTSGLPTSIDLCTFPDYDSRISAILEAKPMPSVGSATRGQTGALLPVAWVGYSPLDFMLTGVAIETLTALPLAQAIGELVLHPLNLRAQYAPLPHGTSVAVIGGSPELRPFNANARCLDDEAGHAGLFGSTSDMIALVNAFRAENVPGRLLSNGLVAEAIHTHTARNGLGWMSNPSGYGYTRIPNGLVWFDLDSSLAVVILTNAVLNNPETITMLQTTWRTLFLNLQSLADNNEG